MGADDGPDWPALYAGHREAMYRAAVRTLWKHGLADHAEDVMHDAFMSVMNADRDDVVRNWEAFLVSAVKWKAIDLIRSAANTHAGGPLDAADVAGAQHGFEDDVAESLDAARDGAVLWDALGRLDERERRILWQHKALGRTREVVAREFGISAGRVSQICIAAMGNLRQVLSEGGVHR